MARLAVDQFGQIYETSPDRDDGLGYGSRPEPVSQGDLTLGAAYLKSQSARQMSQVKLRRDNLALDAQDEMTRRIAMNDRARSMQKELSEINMIRSPQVREAVLRQALSGGCECEYSTPMSGNVFTANGQSGWAGMTRDQKTIQHVTMGQGHNVAHRVDPLEERQFQERAQADRILRLSARR